MERPIDQIKQAEQSMKELRKAAQEMRQQIDLACAQNPQETAELRKAAALFQKEVERIQEYLEQWKRSIQ